MTIDHVGIVVSSLDGATAYYTTTFGLRAINGRIVDPLQDVELQFLEDDDGARLELICPLSTDSPVARALTQGGGLNHICYRVADLESSMGTLVRHRAFALPYLGALSAYGTVTLIWRFWLSKQGRYAIDR